MLFPFVSDLVLPSRLSFLLDSPCLLVFWGFFWFYFLFCPPDFCLLLFFHFLIFFRKNCLLHFSPVGKCEKALWPMKEILFILFISPLWSFRPPSSIPVFESSKTVKVVSQKVPALSRHSPHFPHHLQGLSLWFFVCCPFSASFLKKNPTSNWFCHSENHRIVEFKWKPKCQLHQFLSR